MTQSAPDTFAAFVGIDWADAKHDVCLQAAGSAKRECFQLEHTPVRDSVVPGSVHPPGEVADVVGAGDAGQEGKHDVSVPTRRF